MPEIPSSDVTPVDSTKMARDLSCPLLPRPAGHLHLHKQTAAAPQRQTWQGQTRTQSAPKLQVCPDWQTVPLESGNKAGDEWGKSDRSGRMTWQLENQFHKPLTSHVVSQSLCSSWVVPKSLAFRCSIQKWDLLTSCPSAS